MTDAVAVGTRVGRFEVGRRLGAGGMGAVYEARDPELSRAVAIKVLRDRGGDAMRLLREAQALARISHPNVIGVFELGSHDGQVFIAMELVDGETLDAHLRARRRGWREVLALFVAIGRGIAAVHAQGLVHRDIKPSNILVDVHGRVRVGDFGLARQDDGGASSSGGGARPRAAALTATTVDQRAGRATVDGSAPAATPDGVLASPLTETGAVIGTPRYMAPEQHRGLRVTRAADQFAYCVALWEALYGEHPFGPGSQLIDAVIAGRRRDPPGGRGVPTWLERAVARGLAQDPAARWPSMDALVDELEARPRRHRRIALGAGMLGAIGAAVAGGVLIAGRGHAIDCGQAGDELAAVWRPEQRAALVHAFAHLRPYGGDVATRVAGELDQYVVAWRDARVDACRATHERGEESADMLDRRAACYDDRANAVRALVPRLLAADGKAVDQAIDAVAALPDLRACAVGAVANAPPPSRDPRAVAIRAQVADATAAFQLGRMGDAVASADRAIPAARELGDPALLAAALLARGRATIDTGAPQGRADLEEAETLAARAHDGEVEAVAATDLFAAAADVGDDARADSLQPAARAAIERGGSARVTSDELSAEAQLLGTRGRFDDELATCDRITPIDAVRATWCRCAASVSAGRYDAAKPACQASLEASERRYGPTHVRVATVLHDLGVLEGHLGEYATELDLGKRSLAIDQAAYGDSLPTARDLGEVADSLLALGQAADGLGYAKQELEMIARLGNPKNDEVAVAHHTMARALLQAHRAPEAIDELQQALALTTELQGPNGRNVSAELIQLGKAQLAADRNEDALATYRKVQPLAEKTFGPRSQTMALLLGNEAGALIALHRPREAIPLLEQVRGMADEAHITGIDLAFVNAILGVAYTDAGDHPHAREALLRARALYVAAGPQWASDVKEVDEALAKAR
jgi:tetratricopeptide (TPR) repeat protein